jgi:hypothetical protein
VQRLGAFRAFPLDGEKSLKASFAALRFELDEFLVLVAPRTARANVALIVLP